MLVVFPAPLIPATRIPRWPRSRHLQFPIRLRHLRQYRQDLIPHDLFRLIRVLDLPHPPGLADFADHSMDVFDAHVGLKKLFLPLGQRGIVDLPAGNEKRPHIRVKHGRRLAERAFELVEGFGKESHANSILASRLFFLSSPSPCRTGEGRAGGSTGDSRVLSVTCAPFRVASFFSRNTASSTPFTNDGLCSVENSFASSIASSRTTFGGVAELVSSQIARRIIFRSTPGWRRGGHCGPRVAPPTHPNRPQAKCPRLLGDMFDAIHPKAFLEIAEVGRLPAEGEVDAPVRVPEKQDLHRQLANFPHRNSLS